jgi:hypothetical protein
MRGNAASKRGWEYARPLKKCEVTAEPKKGREYARPLDLQVIAASVFDDNRLTFSIFYLQKIQYALHRLLRG